MFHILRMLKDLIIHPGHCYTLPECIVVGLPMSYNSEYELQIHWPDSPREETTNHPIPSYMPDEVREVGSPAGFIFEDRNDNTTLVTFDPTFMRIWTAGSKQDLMFSLYDKTNDVVLLNRYRFIVKRGAANW